MSFTRSTTTTNVHSTLGDYPSVDDGLNPTQLKARFDAPATGLKSDLNGLMTELEATTSAASVGAAPMFTGDTSGANVQAKLDKIQSEIEAIALDEIPDNTITEAKLVSTYSSTLAKKNGNVQTGLNSEKLGGKTLATIESDRTTAINSAVASLTSSITGLFKTGTVTLNSGSNTVTIGFKPKMIIFVNNGTVADGGSAKLGVIVGDTLICPYKNNRYSVTITSTGCTFNQTGNVIDQYLKGSYNYFAVRDDS